MTDRISKANLIKHLGLQPHPTEGGYYAEIYKAERWSMPDGNAVMDTIYYMLTDDSPIGHFHKNNSDIVHFYHLGSALRYTTIDPQGQVNTFVLGQNFSRGEVLQCVVPAGYWKATELVSGSFGLIGEAVTPAFSEKNRVLADRAMLQRLFPEISADLLRLSWQERRTDHS
jgi:predicted cupin superfamily sugar epimerase